MRVIVQNLTLRTFNSQKEADSFVELTTRFNGPQKSVELPEGGFIVVTEKGETYDTDGLIRGFDPQGNLHAQREGTTPSIA